MTRWVPVHKNVWLDSSSRDDSNERIISHARSFLQMRFFKLVSLPTWGFYTQLAGMNLNYSIKYCHIKYDFAIKFALKSKLGSSIEFQKKGSSKDAIRNIKFDKKMFLSHKIKKFLHILEVASRIN